MLASELHPMIVVLRSPDGKDRPATKREVELHDLYSHLDAK